MKTKYMSDLKELYKFLKILEQVEKYGELVGGGDYLAWAQYETRRSIFKVL